MKQYSQARIGELPPHIFAIAEAAYYNMRTLGENQSVIISGESGAGKTESTKLILQYLTAITSNQDWVEQQIMEANTILESFGNAKTVRNNNSSRFGKFLQVHFDKTNHIVGASLVNYLLEKSRVVSQAMDERNYHCFYQLCAGATAEERTKYKLLKADQFHYLSQSKCVSIPGTDDAKLFEQLKLAFTVMNCTPEEVDGIFRILSAILHLGNAKFQADETGDKSSVVNTDSIDAAASLLEVDAAGLSEALCYRSIVVRGEQSKIPLNVDQSKDNRDSIAKALYSRLFDWIVLYINNSTMPKGDSSSFIGVLDIFGFELFKVNSFEQFCINFANEKLQQFFTNYIFKLEQAEYDREGIKWDKVDFTDNSECIEMIEGKTGILSLLDEESKFPKSTDQTLLDKLHEKTAKNKLYVKPRQAVLQFGVIHYAGEVTYEVGGFLDKNKDEASELIFELLLKSKNDLARVMGEAPKEADNSSGKVTMKKKATVSTFFRNQLTALVTVLGSTSPHYVRCVKPNSNKSAFEFEDELVVSQLRYSGMLETIRIRKAGYAVRVTAEQFLAKFLCLVPPKERPAKGAAPNDLVVSVLNKYKAPADSWQLGKTKVFLRNSIYLPIMDAKEKFITSSAIMVTKVIKGHYYRVHFVRQRKAVTLVKQCLRMFAKREIYRRKKRSAIKLQSIVRGWFARDYVNELRREKAEAEERARQEAIEAERKRQEEEIKRSKEAEEAEARRQAEAAKEREKRHKEEQEILELTREATKAKVNMTNEALKPDDIGDMFSFLDVIDKDLVTSADVTKRNQQLNSMITDITSELDSMYQVEAEDYKKTISRSKRKANPSLAGSGLIPDAPAPPPVYKPPPRKAAKPLLQRQAEKEAEKKGSAPSDEGETMETFAERFYDEHEKMVGTISNTLRKKKSKVSQQEMLMFTKNPIPSSMIKFTGDDIARREKMVTVAVEIFRELLKITDPQPKREEHLPPMIQNVVKLGIGVVELRDEIFVQLVRQCTENPKELKHWSVISIKTWQMMLVCLSSFPPSKALAKPLRNFIKKNTVVDEAAEGAKPPLEEGDADWLKKRIELRQEIVKLAIQCEEAFKNTVLNGARKLPPSAIEIDAIKTGRPIVCRFYFLDGNVKAIGIKSSTTASDALKELAKRIGLPDTNGWSVYEVTPDSEVVVKANDNMADILARWELERRSSSDQTKYQTMKKGAPAVQAIGGGDAKFYVKRRLFRTPQKIPTDPVEYHLIYAQAVHSALRGDFPLTEAAVIRLAALKAQVEWGDYDEQQLGRIDALNNYIPERYQSAHDKAEWLRLISAVHAKLAGKSTLQAKVLFLEAVKQFPTYGCALFPATYKGFWAYSTNLAISIHVDGFAWVHGRTKADMRSYTYDRLESWELDTNTIIFNLKPETSEPENEVTRVEFECMQCEEVVAMIKDYSPAHRAGITREEKENARRLSEMEVDDSVLGHELTQTREKLLDAGIMRLPGPDTMMGGSTGTSKFGTLKKLTLGRKSSTQKLPATGGSAADYTQADWSFNKSRLSFSLCNFDLSLDADLNENALRMNNALLVYAGMQPNPAGGDEESQRAPYAGMLQDMMRGCIEVPRARDELILQLIRLTTNHPEPDSKAALRFWKVLAICCWCFAPSLLVLNYLRAHLAAHSYGNMNSLRHKREREHAKYCYRAITRTFATGLRKQPPSVDEIIAVTNLKDMFARFHFMDGQSRALTFDPACTTAEIVELVKDKVGIKSCTGFALFESFGSLERAMTGKEKIADTIYKWDKYAKQTNSDKSLRLFFKRRIFMPPLNTFSNDIERELVIFQAMSDISNDRYPVDDDEAVYLAALRTQFESGNHATYNPEESLYADTAKKFLPKHLVKQGVQQQLAAQHQKLSGKSKDECNRLFMEQLFTWEFYGSTVFNVLQSYTSQMPNNLWLAINHTGVYVLNRRSKTPLLSFPYKSIVNYSPSQKNIMIMTESLTRGTKYVFNTSEASVIAHLIKDYTDAILAARKAEAIAAKRPAAKK